MHARVAKIKDDGDIVEDGHEFFSSNLNLDDIHGAINGFARVLKFKE